MPEIDANKSFAFTLAGMKKFKEVTPLVGIMAVAVVGVSGFCTYALLTKPDVQLNRKADPRWTNIDLDKPQKMFNLNQPWGENPETTALKKEIHDSYKN